MERLLHRIYTMPIPIIIVVIIIFIAAWAVIAIIMRDSGKKKAWIWLNRILLVLFILVILRMTVFTRGSGVRESLGLFGKLKAAVHQKEYYREMLMNLFLFVPFGLMAPFAFIRARGEKSAAVTEASADKPVSAETPASVGSPKTKKTVLIAILLAFLLSLIIEFLQLAMSLGVPEAEDIICDTLGAAVGTLAFVIWNRTY